MFADRRDAGRQLARRLASFAGQRPVIVAMPRGGVPVASEVAQQLHAPLDIVVVRKVGCPGQSELGLGAIAEGGVHVLNQALISQVGVSPAQLEQVMARERVELGRRVTAYRGERPPMPLERRVALLIDDGLATGYTARAAIEALRARGARQVILAVPVGPEDTLESMRSAADAVVALESPPWFFGIGEFYDDFSPTSDAEVVAALAGAGANPPKGALTSNS